MISFRKIALWIAMLSAPLALGTVCYATYPFSDVIASKTISTSGLTHTQKSNIQLAAASLEGTVIRSGEYFSFNRLVGPRTSGRGYRPAPSYLGPENPATIGGGVCLVSSGMYQLALETGCKVTERVPHLRTIRTVPAGLDATVWYGQADLRFINTLPCPVQIATKWEGNALKLSFLGRRPAAYKPAKLMVCLDRKTDREMVVELFSRQGDRESLVSRDRYVVSR